MEARNLNLVFSPITQNEKADIYGHLSRIPIIIKKMENIRKKCKDITDLQNNMTIKDLVYRLTLLINNLNILQKKSAEINSETTYQQLKTRINIINAEYKEIFQKRNDLLRLMSYDLPDIFISIEMNKEIQNRLINLME